MSDVIIFGFGLCVSLVVTAAISSLIVSKNRAIERERLNTSAAEHGPEENVS